jgi:hypothetical protein
MLADIEGKALDVAVAELKKGGIDASGVECDYEDARQGGLLRRFENVLLVCLIVLGLAGRPD